MNGNGHAPQAQEVTRIPMLRLKPDDDVGLLGVQLSATLNPDGNVIISVIAVCARPSVLAGGFTPRQIPLRVLGVMPADQIIKLFQDAEEAEREANRPKLVID